jgi:hypothetical protein
LIESTTSKDAMGFLVFCAIIPQGLVDVDRRTPADIVTGCSDDAWTIVHYRQETLAALAQAHADCELSFRDPRTLMGLASSLRSLQ